RPPRQPVLAARDRHPHDADAVLPARAGLPLPLEQQAMGQVERSATRIVSRCEDGSHADNRRPGGQGMTKRIRIVLAAAVAAITVPALVLAATTAYTSPTLKVSYAGSTTVITASAAPADDATAVATIYVPTGTTLTTNQTPGTPIGSVKAQVSAL